MTAAFTTGFGLGFLVAAQVGPVWLLCVRSVLRGRTATGLAIGAAAALVDTAYAALGVAGAATILEIAGLRIDLGLLGASFLIYIGTRTMWHGIRARSGMETLDEVADPRKAFFTGLAATAANPSTIISWAAIFTAAHTADVASSGGTATVMLAGVGIGSFTWFLILSVASGVIGARLRRAGAAAHRRDLGLALAGFGVYLGVGTLRTPDSPFGSRSDRGRLAVVGADLRRAEPGGVAQQAGHDQQLRHGGAGSGGGVGTGRQQALDDRVEQAIAGQRPPRTPSVAGRSSPGRATRRPWR